MDFREVASLLQGASVKAHSLDLSRGRLELVTAGSSPRTVIFAGISSLEWTGLSPGSAPLHFSIVGLEKLGAGESWRLYVRTAEDAELELSCASVICEGEETTGIGRSYRH